MHMTRVKLFEGVYLNHLPDRKFKTALLSANFITPLHDQTAAAYALIPAILRRGTQRFPNLGAIEEELDRLYGTSVDYVVRKYAETQCIGFVAVMPDDRYLPPGERLLEPVADLVGELIGDPVTAGGRFVPGYFESEKANLLDDIRSILDDKREYAARRLIEELCRGSNYAVSRYGSEASALKLRLRPLFALYRELIANTRLELIYCGSAPLSRVQGALSIAFGALPRDVIPELPVTEPFAGGDVIRRVEERMDVSQGKLGLGFACGGGSTEALLLGSTIFGGSSNSKLFMHVRERLSLCYYASSQFHQKKRLITVGSGVEFSNLQVAEDEILSQLTAIQNGEIEPWEFEAARAALKNAYGTVEDSLGGIESFALSQLSSLSDDTPEKKIARIEATTLDEVIAAMREVHLDTVYTLLNEEAVA